MSETDWELVEHTRRVLAAARDERMLLDHEIPDFVTDRLLDGGFLEIVYTGQREFLRLTEKGMLLLGYIILRQTDRRIGRGL